MWPWSTKPVIRVKFCEIEIYASSESWINKLSIDVWFVMIGQYGRYFVNTGPEVQKIKIVIIIKIKTYLEMNSKCRKKDIKWNNPKQIMKITYKTF